MLKPVTVARYRPEQFSPPGSGWLGYVETDDWIVFAHEDGRLFVINGRTQTGAALDDSWVEVPRSTG